MQRYLLLLLFAVLLSPLALNAQQDPGAAARIARARATLAPLAPLVGEWQGDAQAMVGRGTTRTFSQHEDVTWGSMGTLMVIRGTGRSLEPATRDSIEFEAVAIVYVDPEGRVQIRAHRDGNSIDPEVEIRPDTLVWGFAVPGGRVRYTIAFGGDVWHEIGEFVRDGAPPVKTMEMRLRRGTGCSGRTCR